MKVYSRYLPIMLVALVAGLLTIMLLGYAPLPQLTSAATAGTAVAGPNTQYLPLITADNVPTRLDFVPVYVNNDLLGDVTDIAHANDNRLFIVERPGRIVVIENGQLLDVFLDLPGMVGGSNWEEGLLGLAFHPDYPQTPYFYVMYTESGVYKRIVVARYTVSNNPNQADPSSALILMRIDKSLDDPDDPLSFSPVHNGGDLTFGPDGYLYIPIGDGGGDPFMGIFGDPDNDSQQLDRFLGKILRIDVDPNGGLPSDCGNSANYSIPADNPFVGQAGCDEIWAFGLRNPWRMSFDALTGDLYVADVGESQKEEVNFVPAGNGAGWNFGWNCYEGSYVYRTGCPGTFTFPVFEYQHSGGCTSVVGGIVYRGDDYPRLRGYYVFGDFCADRLWAMRRDHAGVWEVLEFPFSDFNLTTFGEDVNGELYAGRSDFDGIYRVESP